MALIASQFGGAFQLGAFQSSAFQVDSARVDTAGDIATPAEIAYLERRRRVQQYLDDRRKRYDLQRLRKIDAEIDKLLAERSGAEGERHESEAKLKGLQSAVKPHTINRGAGRTELGAITVRLPDSKPPPKRPSPHRSSKSLQILGGYGSAQSSLQQQALADVMIFQPGPTRMTPDQLMAALAQGTAQMQSLRGY